MVDLDNQLYHQISGTKNPLLLIPNYAHFAGMTIAAAFLKDELLSGVILNLLRIGRRRRGYFSPSHGRWNL